MYSKILTLCCLYFFSMPLWAEEKQSIVSFPSDSSIDAVFLHIPLESKTLKKIGMNKSAIYTTDDNTILHIKEREKVDTKIRLYDPLAISYLTSKILSHIIPKQIAKVFVVHTANDLLVGSYDIPKFQKSQKKLTFWEKIDCNLLNRANSINLCDFFTTGILPEDQKNRTLLDLVLDLTDTLDRNDLNMGTSFMDNEYLAVTVDVDRSGLGMFEWFADKDYPYFFDTEIQDALYLLSLISDETFAEICDNALRDLHNAINYRFDNVESQIFLNEKEKEQFFKNIDFFIQKAKYRKHQMRWAYEHLDAMKTETEKYFFRNSFLRFLINNKAPADKVQILKSMTIHNSNSI